MVLPCLNRHEHLRPIHSAADRDGAADRRNRSRGTRRFSAVTDRAFAAGGFSDHQRSGNVAGRESGHHGERQSLRRWNVSSAHIAGVNEMTSASYLGTTTITLQFDLNRNIDGAARDVQAAINAARANLPSNLPNNPTYRKVNPADAPILIVALTSDIYNRGQLYDAASTIIQQRLLQIEGVGQVNIGGGALPGVRVEINPTQLNSTASASKTCGRCWASKTRTCRKDSSLTNERLLTFWRTTSC